ncbi:MAG: hypothetical protein KKH91_00390 [Elusimicrobia bacterium]|nr:hypothetical protein [Elusimicrobiota bacterium]MBU2614624.1 hypothetical protein [Elusimicrobiota bacterium]
MKKPSVLITAGPTREYIDPVRFISNASSGKTAYSIADCAVKDDAGVTLISGPVTLPRPENTLIVPVETTGQMFAQAMKLSAQSDIIIFCAAVCDFRPVKFNKNKIKKGNKKEMKIRLVPTENILHHISASYKNSDKVFIGFALETKDLVKNTLKKLKAENLDLIIANPSSSIGNNKSQGYFIFRSGEVEKIPVMTKEKFAQIIWNKIKTIYGQKKRIS